MSKNPNYEIKAIQQKMVETLFYFQDFCETHDLHFTLAGGSCLGAVRHQGIIPWDDDIDVFMLRKDYEKLIQLWNKYADTSRYSCLRSNDQYNIHHAATEIRDNHTTFITTYTQDLDINQGVMIDVIPIDYVANSIFKRYKQIFYALLFACFNFQRLPKHKSGFTKKLTQIALTLVKSFDKRYKIWKHCEDRFIKLGKKNNGQVASFIEGLKIIRQVFPEEWITEPSYLDFEGRKMPVPQDYHQWLKMSYGDYMTPPPLNDRDLRHDIIFADMDNSYLKYKGIYYCMNLKKD